MGHLAIVALHTVIDGALPCALLSALLSHLTVVHALQSLPSPSLAALVIGAVCPFDATVLGFLSYDVPWSVSLLIYL